MPDLVDQMTERLLAEAGIGPGMRVLDAGCAVGNLSRMLAERVGPAGEVVGLDHDPALLAVARTRLADLPNVSFVEADLLALPADLGRLDAVAGRRVLMYLPDPAAAVAGLAGLLRPGGIAAFQENDTTLGPGSSRPLPLHATVHRWIWGTVEREGADPRIGFRLPQLLAAAGLAVESARAEAVVETASQPRPVGPILRAMLPRIAATGVADPAEIDPETIDQRLAEELRAADATWVGELVFSVWGRRR